jgi:hypothetical protein
VGFAGAEIAGKMAGARFELVAAPDGEDQFIIRYRPMRLLFADAPSEGGEEV